ncbi:hypothetical protein [Priestia aryabhattai]
MKRIEYVKNGKRSKVVRQKQQKTVISTQKTAKASEEYVENGKSFCLVR